MVKNIAIVSLSRGILGEDFISHELEIGIRRLREYGLNVIFMPNTLKGLEYIQNHPEKRAEDLLQAFRDPSIDMIFCAIGGDDTYRLLPYLFENDELKKTVTKKIFLGYSDSTINHFMMNKVGLPSFYGQSFLSDLCELSTEMLPYTKKYFEELISTGSISEITPSDIWYEQRTDFSVNQVGTPLIYHTDHGFELLQGNPVFEGKILGGCIDSMFDFFDGGRYADMPVLCKKYTLFPDKKEWEGHILLLESSEETMSPEKYEKALVYFKEAGVFEAVNGIIVGKPMNEIYAEEYKELLIKVIANKNLPILFNINVGHALPHCIIPFGVNSVIDANNQKITFKI